MRKGTYREIRNMVFLRVSSLAGISLGATHWYGEIKWYDENDSFQIFELTRILTEASASKLNAQHKKESPGLTHLNWRKGMIYHGFDSKDAVRDVAIEKYHDLNLDCGLAEGRNWASVESRNILVEKNA